MSDKLFQKDIFSGISKSIELILRRFSKIHAANDFIDSEYGQDALDAISMRLQFIGESLKKIEKYNPELLTKYSEVEWKKIINLRDFISHHYDMLNNEIIFDICQIHIPKLKITIDRILSEL